MLDTKGYLQWAVQGTEVERGRDDASFFDALKAAFDYRGDVTLAFVSGEAIIGYLFSLDSQTVGFYPKDDTEKRFVPVADIQKIAFSGRDTAK